MSRTCAALALACVFGCTAPDPAPEASPRTAPVNVPEHLSPEFTALLSNWVPYWEVEGYSMPAPDDFEGWRAANESQAATALARGQGVLDEFGVTVEEREIRGVRVLDVKPPEWERNRENVLIHTHGGGFYANSPESSAASYVPLAAQTRTRVISVDYTLMPQPDWSVLDQRDQVVDVYKSLVEDEGFQPSNVGAIGCSAGGHLALSFVNRLSHEGYPVPGVIWAIAPITDFTFDSDTYTTLAWVDPQMNVNLYRDYAIPMLGITDELARSTEYSIVRDDYTGRDFPPTLIQVGTKEAMMGDAVRMYSRLREDGVEAQIDPYDAMVHCFHMIYQAPESQLAVSRAAEWITRHLNLN